MKFFSASTLFAPLLGTGTLAFLPPSSLQLKATTKIMQPLHATNHSPATSTAAAAASILLGIGLSSQAAFANDGMTLEPPSQYYYSTSMLSSSTVLAEIDKFTLPSYETSKGSVLIDISSDLESVNKKTMAQAKQKREKADTSAEKLQADEMRRAEKDGSSLLESLLGESDLDRRARIEAEKAETRANRWNTF